MNPTDMMNFTKETMARDLRGLVQQRETQIKLDNAMLRVLDMLVEKRPEDIKTKTVRDLTEFKRNQGKEEIELFNKLIMNLEEEKEGQA